MKSNNKADLSITAMIITVLALTVLIVLLVVFTKGSNIFTTGVFDCESKGNEYRCVAEGACQAEKTKFNCPKGQECCVERG